jgi:hypothetical protein
MSVGRRIAGLLKRGRSDEVEPAAVEPVETEAAEQEPERPPEPEAVVNERSARALLARGTPPLPQEPAKPARRRLERRDGPTHPDREPVTSAGPREWNLWELERAVRTAGDQVRQEEWSALFIHLREFANADGDLPVEFDALVRESFAGILEREPEAAPS